MEEIFTKLLNLSADIIPVDPERVSLDSIITEELGVDSLDIVEILARIEEHFGVYIPDADVIEMRTVGDVVKYIYDDLK